MASYLGRNVNLALLIIIIGVVVALVGTTVFFQRSLQNRTGDFESTAQTLEQCQVALANYQNQYSEALADINQTSQDIRKYDQLYEQKVIELKQTQDNLSVTAKQLQFEQLQKAKFQEFYEDERSLNAQLNATIRQQREEILDLEDELDQCQGG